MAFLNPFLHRASPHISPYGGGRSGLTAEGSKPHILEHKDAETLQS